jgi:hypothetical protein
LETFLTQIRPALPLTSDPPVICFWKWIGWKDYEVPKNRNLESVSAKNDFFLTVPAHTCPPVPATGPPDQTQCRGERKRCRPSSNPIERISIFSVAQARPLLPTVGRRFASVGIPGPCWEHTSPPLIRWRAPPPTASVGIGAEPERAAFAIGDSSPHVPPPHTVAALSEAPPRPARPPPP